jgi:hypothetical protein
LHDTYSVFNFGTEARQNAIDRLLSEGAIEPVIDKEKKARNANSGGLFQLVEMRRLELLTPYMRSKCSTS